MVYVLTVAVWLISADGRLHERTLGAPAPIATLAECQERGRAAARELGAIEGVAGAAWLCVPRADYPGGRDTNVANAFSGGSRDL